MENIEFRLVNFSNCLYLKELEEFFIVKIIEENSNVISIIQEKFNYE